VDHHDVSAHRFEQRGLLHVPVHWQGRTLHAVVTHFGLTHGGRLQQVQYLSRFITQFVPRNAPLLVAGDFNDWNERLDAPMRTIGLQRAELHTGAARLRPTFPSRVPVFALDRVYTRGFRCTSLEVPRGAAWARMSDHLLLVVELEAA
jgi:endonuclease/exonuclease/phosphatase family metal-dependent hydrolase